MPRPGSAGPRPASELVRRLHDGGPALVALSGGVDSAAVASLAREALGDELLAATVTSSAVSAEEIATARRVARELGVRHVLVPAEPLESVAYRANGDDRCYHCRKVETGALLRLGRVSGVRQYLDGVHLDDLGEDRPGLRAMEEAGFVHPLLWGRWRKEEVRRYARSAGLGNWDRPSNACLASRVAHGQPISKELLERIERAEALVLGRGFRRVRVRVRGNEARVEVGPSEVARLEAEPLRSELSVRLRELGFGAVTIDPAGYRGGSELPVVR